MVRVRVGPAAAAIATSVFLWASAFVAIRAALPGYGPVGLTTGRLIIASGVFVVLSPFVGIRCPVPSDLAKMALAGLLGMFGYQFLLNHGQVEVTAATASIIIASVPAITAAMAALVLREPVTTRNWAGIGLALAGVVIVSVGTSGHVRFEGAALMVLFAALAQAAYFIVIKPLVSVYRPIDVTVWSTWFGVFFALPFIPVLPDRIASSGLEAHLSVLHLGVAASALGFFTWSVALRHISATAATTYLYLVPPTTIVIGWIWLAELPTLLTVAGGVVVVAGVWLARR